MTRILVGLVTALALGAVAYGGWIDYRASISEVEIFTTQMARAVEAHVSRSLGITRSMLHHVAQEVEGRDLSALTEADHRVLAAEYHAFGKEGGDIYSIWLVDAGGDVVYSSFPLVQPVNLSDRRHFTVLRDGAAEYFGDVIRARTLGEMIFVMSLRLQQPDGRFAGAVLAAVKGGHFQNLFQSLDLGPGAAVGLFHRTGQMLARYPVLDNAESRSVETSILSTTLLPRAPSGSYTSHSVLDGIERIFAYRALADFPMVVTVGLPKRAVLANWVQRQSWVLIISLALIAATVWSGANVIKAVNARVRANRELRAALGEREILLAEVHHRVKNNLQIIQSLLTMESLSCSPDSRAGYQDSLQRIQAMGMVHELLYQSGEFGAIRCRDYLERLCRLLVAEHPGISVRVEGDDPPVDLDRAIPFAMAVNEIISNALKHAFPDGRQGTVSVRLTHGDGRLEVVIADDGIGLSPDFDPGVSGNMGTRLLLGLAAQLRGTVSFTTGGGAVVRLVFPLA